ncbi:MAG: hypothetical protein LBT66_05670 [Methanobrevibacter sp.]|jgi:restriction endonuclease S subunit|nr:hypothetical protein [Candidatus Methanovirga meridionalis]
MNEKKLKDIAEIFTGMVVKRFEKNESLNDEIKEEYYYMTLNNLRDNNLDLNNLESIKPNKIVNKYLLQQNDIIIKLSSPYSVALVDFRDVSLKKFKDKNIFISSNFAVLRNLSYFNPKYLSFILNTNNIKKQIYKYETKASIQTISIKDLKEIKITYTNIKKQEMYGEMLSLLHKRQVLKEEIMKYELKLSENYMKSFKG